MDKSVEILAVYIVEEKPAVISLLNEGGYDSLPFEASIFEVNESVAENILDERFVRKLSENIFPYRNVVPEAAQTAAEAGSGAGAGAAAEGGNHATWIAKIVEVGAGLVNQAKQESNTRAALQAQYDLKSRQTQSEIELAQQRAKQDFAFELRKAQEASAENNTQKNLILLLGVVGILAITFYAVRRGNK